jgi:hypothetical protein
LIVFITPIEDDDKEDKDDDEEFFKLPPGREKRGMLVFSLRQSSSLSSFFSHTSIVQAMFVPSLEVV